MIVRIKKIYKEAINGDTHKCFPITSKGIEIGKDIKPDSLEKTQSDYEVYAIVDVKNHWLGSKKRLYYLILNENDPQEAIPKCFKANEVTVVDSHVPSGWVKIRYKKARTLYDAEEQVSISILEMQGYDYVLKQESIHFDIYFNDSRALEILRRGKL